MFNIDPAIFAEAAARLEKRKGKKYILAGNNKTYENDLETGKQAPAYSTDKDRPRVSEQPYVDEVGQPESYGLSGNKSYKIDTATGAQTPAFSEDPADKLMSKARARLKRALTNPERDMIKAVVKGYRPTKGSTELDIYHDIFSAITDDEPDKFGLGSKGRPEVTTTAQELFGTGKRDVSIIEKMTPGYRGDEGESTYKPGTMDKAVEDVVTAPIRALHIYGAPAVDLGKEAGQKLNKGLFGNTRVERPNAPLGGESIQEQIEWVAENGLDPIMLAGMGAAAVPKLAALFAEKGMARVAAKDMALRVLGAIEKTTAGGQAGHIGPKGAKGMTPAEWASYLGVDESKIAYGIDANKFGSGKVGAEGVVMEYAKGSPYKGEYKLLGFTPEGKFAGIDVESGRYFELNPKFDGKPVLERKAGQSIERLPHASVDIPSEIPKPLTIQEEAAQRLAKRGNPPADFKASIPLEVPKKPVAVTIPPEDEIAIARARAGLQSPAGLADDASPAMNEAMADAAGLEHGRIKPEPGAPGAYEDADVLAPKGTTQPKPPPATEIHGPNWQPIDAKNTSTEDVLADILTEKPKPRKSDVQAMTEAMAPNKHGVPLAESKQRIAEAMIGIKGPSVGEKIVGGVKSFVNKMTRQFELLPRGSHGALKFAANKLAAARSYANGEAHRLIDKIMGGLTLAERQSLAKKVLANDLFEDLTRGKQLPFGFDEESFLKWHKEVSAENPHLQKLVDQDKQIVNAMTENLIEAAKGNGVDLSFLRDRPDYFRHQVLDKMKESMGLAGDGKIRVPGLTGSLKERAGTALDINANYAQSRFETMQNLMKEAEWHRFQQTLRETEDVGAEWRALAKRTGKRLEDVVPDGYVVRDYTNAKYGRFQDPVGHAMQDILTQAGDAGSATRAVTGAEPMVLKKEVAATVDAMFAPNAAGGAFSNLSEGASKATGAWKWWRLNNPKTAPLYHLRNATGDLEAAMNHTAMFRESKTAYQHLMDVVVRGKEPDKEMVEWMKRGGFSTFERIQELAQLGKIKEFQQVADAGGFLDKAMRAGTAPFKKYKEALDKFGDVREGILRYADYRATLKELEANGGKFATHGEYGASLKEEVDAIKDLRDKAFKISNERMGAYDTMTVMGKKLRETIFPFWSWKEVNAKRTYGILRNAMRDGKAGGVSAALGKSMGAKSVGGAVALGRTTIKLALPVALYTAYNKTVMGDIEKDLPDYVRNRPHINLGRGADGKPMYIDGIGAFGDLLSWAGVDTNSGLVRDWMDGRASFTDVVKGIAKAPVNVLAQQTNPMVKAAVVMGTGKDFYPDAFHPRQVRDTAKYVLDQVALGQEYAALKNIPQEDGYLGTWKELLYKKIDPAAGAYNETVATISRFKNKIGLGREGGAYTERQNNLYYHKLALRYGDKEKADYWMDKYVALGGSPDGVKKSIDSMAPDKMIPKEYRQEFIESLDAESKRRYDKAMDFWNDVLQGKQLDAEQAAKDAADNDVQENIHKSEKPKSEPGINAPEPDYVREARERMKKRGK